jgi:hypothetical protein
MTGGSGNDDSDNLGQTIQIWFCLIQSFTANVSKEVLAVFCLQDK